MKKIKPGLLSGFYGMLSLVAMAGGVSSAMAQEPSAPDDWLVRPPVQHAVAVTQDGGRELVLTNGLLRRVFRLRPNLACVSFTNLSNGQELLRAVKPEARIVVDGKPYNIGGLYGQQENAYLLPGWVDSMDARADDFTYRSFTLSPLQPYLQWQPRGWVGNTKVASGIMVEFDYSNDLLPGVSVKVHYEVYDGIPLLVKWLSVANTGGHHIRLDRVVNEVLGVVEEESAVEGRREQMAVQHGLYVETNYAFNNSGVYHLSDQTTHWKADSGYTSQVHYRFQTPCLLEVYPEKGPGIVLNAGDSFRSVRTAELLIDSYDRERRGLSIRKMYRVLLPWTTENPLFMHLVSRNDEEVKRAVDQCAATGYEMLILSFGSHCQPEDTSASNIRRWKALAAYAHQRGIRIGGYSLFSSRRIDDADDVIDPVTGKPDAAAFFGSAPCLGSRWGLAYLEKLKYFLSQANFDLLEQDGPYPGDVCASVNHPGHQGLDDSQWRQMELQKGLYRWCNAHGIYVNAPDWYYADGSNKAPLGYREVNFALSRDQQKILNRQNIYDGLWERIPAMCWGFVPLTEYHGGGPESVLEPLGEHLGDYRQLMMQYYGAGVQACYRGPRLYDTDSTRTVVTRVVDWYKRHRDILNADVLHLRRADGKEWDGIMHVSATGRERGLVMLYNPLGRAIERRVDLPLYYTGLAETAMVRVEEGPVRTYTLDRRFNITVDVSIPAGGYTWLVIEDPAATRWMGFRRTDTVIAGRPCIVVEPSVALPGRPWIWRTEFFGHEPQGDSMLAAKGFHVVYMDIQNMYGAPPAMALMDSFYHYLITDWKLNRKTVLEGFSRGGLYAFNWAARHPGSVYCLYVDAPVCDFKSWPGGKGKGQYSAGDWELLFKAYGFTSERQALAYKGNPIDNLKPLAAAHIPILCVCGDADTIVPMPENILIVQDRYRKLGGDIRLIVKPGNEHHPHSLKDPTPIVDFVMAAVGE
ncbi:MAG: alpha-galactosidase [Puia sp.]|nr:alpha-galactosidase [Puia sp.]